MIKSEYLMNTHNINNFRTGNLHFKTRIGIHRLYPEMWENEEEKPGGHLMHLNAPMQAVQLMRYRFQNNPALPNASDS
jgi:hypothetical protein